MRGWIRVSEQVPRAAPRRRHSEQMLVVVQHTDEPLRYIDISEYSYSAKKWQVELDLGVVVVTHYRPLPALPRQPGATS